MCPLTDPPKYLLSVPLTPQFLEFLASTLQLMVVLQDTPWDVFLLLFCSPCFDKKTSFHFKTHIDCVKLKTLLLTKGYNILFHA